MAQWSESEDAALRLAAMEWLSVMTQDGLEPISSREIEEFRLDGDRFRLLDAQRGIRKPKELAAALSIRTVYRPDGAIRPYQDGVGPDGRFRYKWRGDDAMHAENRALREAQRRGVPLIWFIGVGPANYQPVYPIYLTAEEPELQQFVVDTEATRTLPHDASNVDEYMRRYIMVETARRLHQPVFRATVMRAYQTRCAVCRLQQSELLDAAHIVPDSQAAGAASVRNGLALCKIHHGAFDARILGVRTDYVIEIRDDLLDLRDGPMLRHGLQDLHGRTLMALPRSKKEHPDRDLLASTYAEFKTASGPERKG